MKDQQLDFEDQIRDQCEDYQELLCEKRTRDLEIAAYRSVHGGPVRLCMPAVELGLGSNLLTAALRSHFIIN